MTNQEQLITPSTELVQNWVSKYLDQEITIYELVTEAYKAGADQELDACCMWITKEKSVLMAEQLDIARRPKPPSLKEQALEQLGCIQTDLNKFGMGISTDTIRRALEALPE